MKRRVIVLMCLLGVIGGGAGAALAVPSPPVQATNHNICVVVAQHENYNKTQYYCVTTP